MNRYLLKNIILFSFVVILLSPGCSSASGDSGNKATKTAKIGPLPGSTNVRAIKPNYQSRAENPTCPKLAPPKMEGTRILVDISGSMRGFTGKHATFQLIHNAINDSVARIGAQKKIERCLVGDSFDHCKNNIKNLAKFNRTKFYKGNSQLHLALVPPPLLDGCQQVDPMETAEINLMITDGVQVAGNRSVAQGETSEIACINGTDPHCLKTVLIERIRQGFGVWISFGYLPFKGLHFPERPLRKQDWKLIEQHLNELRVDPLFENVVKFKAKKPRLPSKATKGFRFSGVKPLIFIVFTKDIQKGRKFVKVLDETFKREKIFLPHDTFFSMELAPLNLPRYSISKVSRGKPSNVKGDDNKFGQSEDFKIMPSNAIDPKIFPLHTKCEIRNGAWMTAYLDKTGGENYPWLTQSLELYPYKYNLPSNIFWGWKTLGNKALLSGIKCMNMPEGKFKHTWILQTKNKIKVEKDLWWAEYSSENSFEKPERVYGLKYLISGILDATLSKPKQMQYLTWTMERE